MLSKEDNEQLRDLLVEKNTCVLEMVWLAGDIHSWASRLGAIIVNESIDQILEALNMKGWAYQSLDEVREAIISLRRGFLIRLATTTHPSLPECQSFYSKWVYVESLLELYTHVQVFVEERRVLEERLSQNAAVSVSYTG